MTTCLPTTRGFLARTAAALMIVTLALQGSSGCASRPRVDGAAPGSRAAALGPAAFLAGHWKGPHDGGTWEEFWTTAEGGAMTGTAKMIVGDTCAFFEFSRISLGRDGRIVLHVSPFGRHPPTAFHLAASSSGRDAWAAQFENPENDYPKIIRYTRRGTGGGSLLVAELEGSENGAPKRETITMTLLR